MITEYFAVSTERTHILTVCHSRDFLNLDYVRLEVTCRKGKIPAKVTLSRDLIDCLELITQYVLECASLKYQRLYSDDEVCFGHSIIFDSVISKLLRVEQ